jgi:hypothetical protein
MADERCASGHLAPCDCTEPPAGFTLVQDFGDFLPPDERLELWQQWAFLVGRELAKAKLAAPHPRTGGPDG